MTLDRVGPGDVIPFRLLVRVTCEHPVIGVRRVTVQEERSEIAANAFRPRFEAFSRQELQSVIGLAYVLSGSRSGAEDLAQEAFLAALRHWNTVGMYEDPGGWVRRVVANTEAVKSGETVGHRLVCMSTSGVGWLIQAATGSLGGVGGLVNLWGWAR